MTYNPAWNSSATIYQSLSGNYTISTIGHYVLDPNGADRTVTLPASGNTGDIIIISHTGSISYVLRVLTSGGSHLRALGLSDSWLFVWNGSNWTGSFDILEFEKYGLIWFDPETDIFSDSFTTPQTTDGGTVASWKSKASGGMHKLGSLGADPILKTAIINGHNVIRFGSGGSIKYLGSVDQDGLSPDSMTMFCVIGRSDWTPTGGIWRTVWVIGGNDGSTGMQFRANTIAEGDITAGDAYFYGCGFSTSYGPRIAAAHGLTGSGFHLFTGILSPDRVELAADGTQLTGRSKTQPGSCYAYQKKILIGGSGGSEFFDGDVAALMFVPKKLTRAEKINGNAWLANRFGLTISYS